MLKKTIALLALTLSLFGSEIHWAKDFPSGVAQAQKENKPILFIYSAHNCKYCVYLEQKTLNTPEVSKALNRDFVSIIAYYEERDIFPRELWRPGTPTIWFLNPDGTPMYIEDDNFPIMGAVRKQNFLNILAAIKKDYDEKHKQGKK